MNTINTITNLINGAIEHAKYVLLSIGAVFLLNFLLFFWLLVSFPPRDKPLAIAFVLIFVWPVLLVVYGVLRLRSTTTASEEIIKRRREVTLRYFGICTFCLVVALLFSWRYLVSEDLPLTASFYIVLPLIILAALLVVIAWYWSKYSKTKLSLWIEKAPIHYLFAATALVIAAICYIAYDDLKVFYAARPAINPRIRQTEIAFGVGSFVTAFLAFGSTVLGYLRPSEGIGNINVSSAKTVSITTSDRTVSNRIDSSSHSTREALDRLADKIETTYSGLESLLRSSSIPHSLDATRLVAERIELIRGRLTRELKDLTKRGNLNLTIGILTTLGAVSALFWGLIATQPVPQETQPAGLLRHYLPRISFAVFIEVFSFFFLRLYKTSLEDIKYYHNELTNLDSKLLALEMAISTPQSEALTPILLGLLNTDRNFILKAGESTVELEKVKTEQQYLRSLIDTVSKKIPDFGTVEKN